MAMSLSAAALLLVFPFNLDGELVRRFHDEYGEASRRLQASVDAGVSASVLVETGDTQFSSRQEQKYRRGCLLTEIQDPMGARAWVITEAFYFGANREPESKYRLKGIGLKADGTWDVQQVATLWLGYDFYLRTSHILCGTIALSDLLKTDGVEIRAVTEKHKRVSLTLSCKLADLFISDCEIELDPAAGWPIVKSWILMKPSVGGHRRRTQIWNYTESEFRTDNIGRPIPVRVFMALSQDKTIDPPPRKRNNYSDCHFSQFEFRRIEDHEFNPSVFGLPNKLVVADDQTARTWHLWAALGFVTVICFSAAEYCRRKARGLTGGR
jgi:hypothetical protein